jgi:hypothetical protein
MAIGKGNLRTWRTFDAFGNAKDALFIGRHFERNSDRYRVGNHSDRDHFGVAREPFKRVRSVDLCSRAVKECAAEQKANDGEKEA